LRLYAGVDDGQWRNYAEVGRLMRISRERVRQLLYSYRELF
jgi:DNA-directed RNA polymerase sigma subunit (sigma70/sigma32)